MNKLKSTVLFALFFSACSPSEPSKIKVTNGMEESGFPFVVQMTMKKGTSASTCTGSFVSDSLLLTAAHCVDKAESVTWNGATAGREQFYIHPEWPSAGASCQKTAQSKYDVALVQFPAGTYRGETGRLLIRAPKAGEAFTIVGYGNNLIIPFDQFCKLKTQPNQDNQCEVMVGVRSTGATYDYQTAFTFPAKLEENSVGCSVKCSQKNFKDSLAAAGTTFEDFVIAQCGGNFRDRSYKETGVGTKRSGTNKVLSVGDGVIQFQGAAGGEESGLNSASGAGDSGGPLFIADERGQLKIAGVTHGGSLAADQTDFLKRSVYVDLSAPHNFQWLQTTVRERGLNFPDLK